MKAGKFPHYKQLEAKDCGPTCLKIIAKFYNRTLSIDKLREVSETNRQGSSLLNISDASEKIGFRSIGIKASLNAIKKVPLPCIVHWNENHYAVLYKIKKNKFYVSDPAHGLIRYTAQDFLRYWIGKNANTKTEEGIALLLEPTPQFYSSTHNTKEDNFGIQHLSKYLFKYKNLLLQLIIGLVAASVLQLILPFLTQSIVDIGIQNQDIHFIYLVLFAQLALFVGKTSIEVIRSWILLHLSTRINISLISDFFVKLMNLPISFFDARMTGDILQRINDHRRIEKILTTSSLSVLFSTVNLLVFSLVLSYYSFTILSIFLIGSLLYFAWVIFFLKKREALDYKRFSEVSQEQSKVIELINGMQEIKLHNAEKKKNVKGVEISKVQDEINLLKSAIQSFNQLKKAIKDWEDSYVLKSNIVGKVSFMKVWSTIQTVNASDIVFSVISKHNSEYIAKVLMPMQGSGKVEVGQKVNIKLENYPHEEFGFITGYIKNISLLPNEEGSYLVDVKLPNGLLTSYNKNIEFRQEMGAIAEIITKDLRLIERFFYQFVKLIKR